MTTTKPASIEAVLFDKDGTLLDFEATWSAAIESVVERLSEGNRDRAERMLRAADYDVSGRRFLPGGLLAAGNAVEIAAAWRPLLDGWEPAPLAREIDRIFAEAGACNAAAVAGGPATLDILKQRGFRLGVATSDSLAGIEATLGPLGLLERFDFLAGYDSGHGSKPGPGMVLAFCEAVGAAPEQTAVVGDNLHDIRMGRAAGAGLCIGVLSGTGDPGALAQEADDLLPSIAALPELLLASS